ncbi:MAG TPA: TadE/TadG family type IV pilus assembly protein [Isosphaeraceae bacterium]|jgi:Flp pilus assembly protein TadG|nr:TadE/TadG family type IV pilus assembly protein [Isosphaeraceae bacterium]
MARSRLLNDSRGQSLVEFAISSVVLLLLLMGLLDLSRAFYYAVSLQGAAREGARHGAWYDTSSRVNTYLDDADIMTAVNQALSGAGLTGVLQANPNCLVSSDGNTANNKPYAASAFPSTPQSVNVYICYTKPGGAGQVGTMTGHPTDNSWRLGDVNVSLLMNFQLITPFIQAIFGRGVNVAYNEHFTIQGKP